LQNDQTVLHLESPEVGELEFDEELLSDYLTLTHRC
jgi:hypothetical protein